jgi:multiple sugar transport system ATP-binding protein
MIFQSYALYPHMTVFQNVAFGLKVRRVEREEMNARVREALEVVELTGFENRRPKQLSGGQQQRVAVARTIAANPEILLYDEPLSNLDPELRVSVRAHLKQIHRRIGATSLFVTHDQQEAMILADRMAVMDRGVIAQIGHPQHIYTYPATAFVAEFTGDPKTNLIRGEVHVAEGRPLLVPERDPYCFIPLGKEALDMRGREVIFHVRPEDLELTATPTEDEGSLAVMAVMQEGARTYAHLRFGEGSGQLIARDGAGGFPGVSRGTRVGLRFRRGNIFDPETGQLAASFGHDARVTSGR